MKHLQIYTSVRTSKLEFFQIQMYEHFITQQTLFKYSQNQTNIEEVIPRLIHQTWKNETIPEKFLRPFLRCKTQNSGYQFRLWTDESARKFISENYGLVSFKN